MDFIDGHAQLQGTAYIEDPLGVGDRELLPDFLQIGVPRSLIRDSIVKINFVLSIGPQTVSADFE